MKVLRTPDERFENLPGFPFTPNYATINDAEGNELRIHYLDEGPADADPVVLLHGEPSWSYLYRHMIPALVDAGHRVVVPDQVGFGRSDKPSEPDDYSYARHVQWMSTLVFDTLGLNAITLFGQDWGGLIGLRLVAAQPDRFARVAMANTGLPTGDRPPPQAFLAWQEFSQTAPVFPIGDIINAGTTTDLLPEVRAAYDAPFPDDTYKAGARIWPSLVPSSPDDPEAPANRAAWEVLEKFGAPFQCFFSDADPITAGGEQAFLGRVPGTEGRNNIPVVGAGHFLQEDAGEQLGGLLVDFIASTGA